MYFVPIAAPDICFLTLPLNSKWLFLKTNSLILIRSGSCYILVFSLIQNVFKRFKFRIVGTWTTSAVTRMALLGIYWMSLIFLLKYRLSLTYDLLLCITSLSWKSKNSETFSVGVLQFEITDLTGTFDNLLCILGSNRKVIHLI